MTRRLSIFLGAIIALAFLIGRASEAAPPVPTQVVFSQVQTSTLTVGWQATTGTTIQFLVELSSSGFFTPLSSTTVLLTSTFTALNVNIQYFTHVRAIDTVDGSSSAFTSSISTYTLANPPVSLATTLVTTTEVDLTWNTNGNPAGTLFAIERSTNGVLFTTIGTQAGSTYSDITVQTGFTYVYRVRALNGSNVPTAASNSVQTGISGSLIVPKRPTGLWAERVSSGGGNFQLTFHWHTVTERTDGSVLSNLTGYQVYTAPSVLAPRAQWTLVTTTGTETFSTTANVNVVNYYALRAIDANGLQSDWTQNLDDTSDLNQFFMAQDNISRVQLPQSAANVLRFEKNTYGADLSMDLSEQTSDETGRVIRSMKIAMTNTATGSPVTDVKFDPPVLRGVLAYSVVNGNVVTGAPEPRVSSEQQAASGSLLAARGSLLAGTPVISAANAASQLSLFAFNGVEWVKTTGVVNTGDNTVSFTGSHVGAFQIRAATHGVGTTLTAVYPRIITPNGDGWNDKAIFQFDNPQLSALSGKIYDITGALVADLKAGPTPDSSLEWDGKDSGGKVVPGGIYMYQIDTGGGTQSGTIVVAR